MNVTAAKVEAKGGISRIEIVSQRDDQEGVYAATVVYGNEVTEGPNYIRMLKRLDGKWIIRQTRGQ